MFGIGPLEMVVVGIVAVLLFGSRLPSVARSLGKSMTEFKKGMREFESEMHSSVYSEPTTRVTYNQQIENRTTPAEQASSTIPARDDSRVESITDAAQDSISPETSEAHSH
jgi:sec-independent protein translocase protein TatA